MRKKADDTFITDLDTVVAAISPSHPNHYPINEKLKEMRNRGTKVVYAGETKTRLDNVLKIAEPWASVLETYPTFYLGKGNARTLTACHTKNPFLMDYFIMRFRSWPQYLRYLEEQLGSKFDKND